MKYARQCIGYDGYRCGEWFLASTRFRQRCAYCQQIHAAAVRRLTPEQRIQRAQASHDRRSIGQTRRRAEERYLRQHGALA